MKKLAFVLAALALAACATVAKVDSGKQAVGERLTLTLEGPWNSVDLPNTPAKIWTMEGLPLDQLRIYSGIKDGEELDRGGPGAAKKPINFRSDMRPDDIVGMFETAVTRDGSTFKLDKLEPWTFGGQKGFRFEYTFTRKLDGVVNLGVGYGAVSKGELFALLYAAPRLGFFARHKDRVEQIARSAVIKA
jgi:hypothetical protein